MYVTLICVLIAGLLPYLWTGVAKATGSRSSGKLFDNADVRTWQSQLTGLPKRAHAAHLNSFEAFPLFAAAVLSALVTGADAQRVMQLAIAYVVLRLLYGLAYVLNYPAARSLIWFAALGCAVAIFLAAIAEVAPT